ncbi:unnamed protein product [Ambrosiozyma monospora]|uniref:Unnamed protein product n=1 Tax=Ambrosiozyma monospora TaxID=43982 RepID=A0ACB5U634_AMBMO|nr:unnamed protein product [Ambrosiozyma monospora]
MIQPVDLSHTYVLPDDYLNRPTANEGFSKSDSNLVFQYEEEPFTFNITRKDTNEVLFSTTGNPLVFSNQFLQFNTSLPQNHTISGLGESYHRYINEAGSVRTLFASDKSTIVDANLYGTHPVYYDERKTGSHAVYWRSSAPQEVLVEDHSLTWRSISGIIDLYFYAGPTVPDAISQFVSSIGMPTLQPYWALGYHQSRWGYDSIEKLETVVENFKKKDIPLETLWSDIDYMNKSRDFTSDPKSFPESNFTSFINKLHGSSQHYVPIVDPAIYYPESDEVYDVYSTGLQHDAYLKNPDGSLYVGEVWPGATVFPDFFANSTEEWWTRVLSTWHGKR